MKGQCRQDRWWVLAFVLIATGATAADHASGRALLNRMARAVQTLDYEGTFIYSHKGELETMYIVHRVDKSGERERLVSLSGSPREILRHNDKVTCYFADDRSVLVDERLAGLFPSMPRQFDDIGNHYDFVMLGVDRVAGFNTRVIDIRPADGYRYGYRLWLEEKSGMLLRYELLDETELPIEQMMFTSVTIGGLIPDNALRPVTRAEGFTWYRDEKKPALKGHSKWVVSELPPGFVLTRYREESMHGDDDPVSHMVYSDGLASVSVYVEQTESGEAVNGYSRIGGLSLYSTSDEQLQVTVVGEVPRLTVETIARSVQPLRVAEQ